ncbi:MAG: DUF4129 domain-containing protein, partial [Cyanobacteria bacterium P01_H01_bin.119]
LPLPERLYQQMLTALAVQGVVKRPHQTPFEYLQTVQQKWTRHRKLQAQIKAVETITQAYVGWRYGDRVVDADILERNLRSLRRATARGQKNKLHSR